MNISYLLVAESTLHMGIDVSLFVSDGSDVNKTSVDHCGIYL
ncbi:hypothetical protein [Moritella sp. 24]|nr:hypothetical protein [Moritella sp. 24]